MESLSLQKVLQSYHGSHMMFPSIPKTRNTLSNQQSCFPRKLYFQEFMPNVAANPSKLSNSDPKQNSVTSTFKCTGGRQNPDEFLEEMVEENPEEVIEALPNQKINLVKQLSDFSAEDFSSPVGHHPKGIKSRLYNFQQKEGMIGQNNELLLEEWHTPEKKLHVFQNNHQNEKQSKFAQMKSQIVEAEFSRLTNDYDILEVLGKGSFGKVYRCTNKVDKGEYAIKETIRNFTGKYKVYGLNETHALASLTALEDNTNVVRYFNSWIEDDKLYLVMEYCPSSLKEERKIKGHYTESEAKKVLRDVCLALSYLHRHNIVHLDVKPENILISKNKKYKLGDMGQSRVAIFHSEDIEEGDSRYVASELLNCDEDDDHVDVKKADIFSLGMTLYELLTDSDIPPNGDDWHKLRNGELQELEEMPGVSQRLKNLIRRMLSKNPADRPSAQELLARDLPSEIELELKWEKIENKLLQIQYSRLEKKVKRKQMRRNSFS